MFFSFALYFHHHLLSYGLHLSLSRAYNISALFLACPLMLPLLLLIRYTQHLHLRYITGLICRIQRRSFLPRSQRWPYWCVMWNFPISFLDVPAGAQDTSSFPLFIPLFFYFVFSCPRSFFHPDHPTHGMISSCGQLRSRSLLSNIFSNYIHNNIKYKRA